jgi:DNA-binding response OmpR family regulator
MIRRTGDSTIDHGEGVVEILIEDTGIGISEAKLPYIFDRFYQADPSNTREQEGTGIGLALVKQMVELHHGSITVTSKKGKGSTFIIHLPLGNAHLSEDEIVFKKGYKPIDVTAIDALPAELDPLLTNHQNGNGSDLPLMLIVEDNEDMRSYLKEVLSERFHIEEAKDGQLGWEEALKLTPDIIISDVMMPGMDGYQLCQKLKTDERTSHIPVVLLTAHAGEEAKLEGLQIGADDYITKPFGPNELRARVHNLIELRRNLRERFGKKLSFEPKEIAITSMDEHFLQRALDIVEIHKSDADFNAEAFAREIGMSRSQLHRKLKALTNQSAGDFVRSYRLKYARQLIDKGFGNVTQVAYECGFNSPSYFAECFKKLFGKLPSEYAKVRD